METKNKLKEYRALHSMTQEELSKSSGISIRTIQRIEKGLSVGSPHTIKTLAKSLDIENTDLLIPKENSSALNEYDTQKVKLMNLSILTIVFIPFGNIIFPMLFFLRHRKNQKVNTMGRKIISFQIISTLLLFFLTIIIFIIIGRGNGQIPLPIFISYVIYVLVSSITVVHTAIEINKKNDILKFAPNIL